MSIALIVAFISSACLPECCGDLVSQRVFQAQSVSAWDGKHDFVNDIRDNNYTLPPVSLVSSAISGDAEAHADQTPTLSENVVGSAKTTILDGREYGSVKTSGLDLGGCLSTNEFSYDIQVTDRPALFDISASTRADPAAASRNMSSTEVTLQNLTLGTTIFQITGTNSGSLSGTLQEPYEYRLLARNNFGADNLDPFVPGGFYDQDVRVRFQVVQTLVFDGTATWKGADGDDWTTAAHWADSQGVEQAPGLGVTSPSGHTAQFPAVLSGVVHLGAAEPNLQAMSFAGNTAYTLTGASGTGHVTFETRTAAPTITVSAPASGTPKHVLDVPVTLADDTTVNTDGAAALLEVSGRITGHHRLTKEGAGKLVLSASDNGYDGTIVNGGTLEIADAGALPAGGALTIGAGATVVLSCGLSGATGSIAAARPVPEPGTVALLVAGSLALFLWKSRKHTRRESQSAS